MSENELKDKEDDAVLDELGKDFSPAEKAEYDKLAQNDPQEADPSPPSDQVGKGFTGGAKKAARLAGFWTPGRKKGGIVGIVVTSGFIAAWGVLAPTFTADFMRSLLLGHDLQISHSIRYRRTYLSKVSDMFTVDGRRGGAIINKMEQNGYKFRFDPNDRTKIVGLTLPGGRQSIPNLSTGALATHIEKFMDVHYPLKFSRWKTKRMEAFYNRYQVSRKSVTTRVGAEVEDPEKAVNAEIADQVVGEEPGKLTTGAEEAADGESDEEKAAREQRNATDESLATGSGDLDGIKAKLREGVSIEDLSYEEQKILQVASRVDQEVIDIMQSINAGSLVSFGSLKGVFSSTDILDKVCTAKNRIRAISFAARNYRALSLLRYTGIFVKAGDSVRTGRTDPKLFSELMKRTSQVDANGLPIGGSPGFTYLLKKRFSRTQNNDAKANVDVVGGNLTGVPGALQQATDTVPGVSERQCGVYQNPAFQIGVAVVEIGAALFSGGSSKAVSEPAKQAVVRTVKESLERIITRQTARALLKTAAIEISFEGALILLQVYAEKAQSLNFTGQEKGGELGSILAAGSGVLGKQRGLQSGMVPATAEQYALANDKYIAESREALKHQGLYARYFDYQNRDSLAFQAMSFVATTPLNLSGAKMLAKSGLQKVGAMFSSPLSIFNGVFASVSAADGDEIAFETYNAKGVTLATDPAGNLLPIMRQDILDIDPDENMQYLINSGDIEPTTKEPISENFKEHVTNCVNAVDTISTIENKDQNNPKYDCMASQSITVRYKAHLAWLDMVDDIDGFLFPEEISLNGSAPSLLNPQPRGAV